MNDSRSNGSTKNCYEAYDRAPILQLPSSHDAWSEPVSAQDKELVRRGAKDSISRRRRFMELGERRWTRRFRVAGGRSQLWCCTMGVWFLRFVCFLFSHHANYTIIIIIKKSPRRRLSNSKKIFPSLSSLWKCWIFFYFFSLFLLLQYDHVFIL